MSDRNDQNTETNPVWLSGTNFNVLLTIAAGLVLLLSGIVCNQAQTCRSYQLTIDALQDDTIKLHDEMKVILDSAISKSHKLKDFRVTAQSSDSTLTIRKATANALRREIESAQQSVDAGTQDVESLNLLKTRLRDEEFAIELINLELAAEWKHMTRDTVRWDESFQTHLADRLNELDEEILSLEKDLREKFGTPK